MRYHIFKPFLETRLKKSIIKNQNKKIHCTQQICVDPNHSNIRLRFAPSPTGFLHLGGLRTALFNHLLSKKYLNGKWILRIEDTDRSRFVEGAIESLIKTLHWANLKYDEGPDRPGKYGPYIQSQRLHIYQKHINRLIESKHAYRCFCSSERLNRMREGFKKDGSNLTYDRKCLNLSEEQIQNNLNNQMKFVIRLKNPDSIVIVEDLVYGELKFSNNTQDDSILIKTDGMPTYHFANVVDDHEMSISHVLRGEEWISSTPKHILLYNALGFQRPKYAHLPLLINPAGSKLSKRSGDVRVEDYINKGYEPEALLNFVALMGMNHAPNSKRSLSESENSSPDVMTIDEMVQAFSIEVIGKHRSTMSQAKLDYLNQKHLARRIDSDDPQDIQPLIKRARTLLSLNHDTDEHTSTYIHKVIFLMKDRLHLFSDLKYLSEYFFHLPDLQSNEATLLRRTIPDQYYVQILENVKMDISNLDSEVIIRQNVSKVLNDVQARLYLIKPKMLMGALRHALTGRKVGAGIADTITVLGKKRTLERLSNAIQKSSQS